MEPRNAVHDQCRFIRCSAFAKMLTSLRNGVSAMDLNKCLKEIGQVNGVTGCVLADNKGLCLGVTGKASKESSGIIKAIADQVGKLHPDLPPPVISLESDSKTCLIQHEGNVTAAVYKNISA